MIKQKRYPAMTMNMSVSMDSTQSDFYCELAELDNLLQDPDFYLEEYCLPFQNEIDLYFEQKLVTLLTHFADLHDDSLRCQEEQTIQQERERCLSELSKFKEFCRSVLFTKYFRAIKEIKEFHSQLCNNKEISECLDALINQVKTKKQDMKLVITNFNKCTFDEHNRRIVV